MSSVTTLRWGIISTGGICQKFVQDLLVDPKTRDVHDVQHRVTAVGSRDTAKAQQFIDSEINGSKAVKAYGSYAEVYADENVDAVYIGTPHTLHYPAALDAIKAKKHVLLEKPVTSNSAELKSLLAAAEEHGVFFMEALWTRFHPLTLEVKRILDSGALGAPVTCHADLSADFDIQNIPKTHRILDPQLGGGAMLDLGPYPLIWAIVSLYEDQRNNSAQPSSITGSMLKTPLTNVDANASWAVNFTPTSSSSLSAQAVLSCSINVEGFGPAATIGCEKGSILVDAPLYCPKAFTVKYKGGKKGDERKTFEYTGKGFHFEADEVARCVRDGKQESSLWGWDKSLLEMKIFDEVRRQNDYVFPEGVEFVQ